MLLQTDSGVPRLASTKQNRTYFLPKKAKSLGGLGFFAPLGRPSFIDRGARGELAHAHEWARHHAPRQPRVRSGLGVCVRREAAGSTLVLARIFAGFWRGFSNDGPCVNSGSAARERPEDGPDAVPLESCAVRAGALAGPRGGVGAGRPTPLPRTAVLAVAAATATRNFRRALPCCCPLPTHRASSEAPLRWRVLACAGTTAVRRGAQRAQLRVQRV